MFSNGLPSCTVRTAGGNVDTPIFSASRDESVVVVVGHGKRWSKPCLRHPVPRQLQHVEVDASPKFRSNANCWVRFHSEEKQFDSDET